MGKLVVDMDIVQLLQLLLISVVPSKMLERQLEGDLYLLLRNKVAERSEASTAY